jgi:peptide/nickel transport system substrate-binding protein
MQGDSRFSLTIDFGWPGVKPQVEYVKAALKKVGIDVEVRASADFPTWAARMGKWTSTCPGIRCSTGVIL